MNILKININNGQYLEIEIKKEGGLNCLGVYTYDNKGNLTCGRMISESEFVDLYNILAYAQDNNKNICDLWEVK